MDPDPSSAKSPSFNKHQWADEATGRHPGSPALTFPQGLRERVSDTAGEPHCVTRSQEKGGSQDKRPEQEAPLTAGKEAQASLLGVKMVKLPGPSISGLSFSVRSV